MNCRRWGEDMKINIKIRKWREHESSAPEETMYGYSAEGEFKKRTLNPSDIARIQEIYGK